MIERLEDSDGLSAILPAMANSVMALKVLGYAADHPLMKEQLGYLDGLLLGDAARRARCACSRACRRSGTRCSRATRWPRRGSPPSTPPCGARRPGCWASRRSQPGDWSQRNPAPPGGWYFEHRNEFYPGRRRHLHGADGAAARARRRAGGRAGRGRAARADLDAGHAERRRRLGQLRSRQRQAVADRGALRRPQRHDRSQHRRHHRAGAGIAEPLPRIHAGASGGAARAGFSAPGSDLRRRLVRALGRELHLRHVAGAARRGVHRRRPRGALRPARRALAPAITRTPTAAGARASPATTIRRSGAWAPRRPARPPGR